MLRLTKTLSIFKEIYEKIPKERWDHPSLQESIAEGKIPLYLVGKEKNGILLIAADHVEASGRTISG